MSDWKPLFDNLFWVVMGAVGVYFGQYVARLRAREEESVARENADGALLRDGARREHSRLAQLATELGTCKYHAGLHGYASSSCKDWTSSGLVAIKGLDFAYDQFRLEYKP